MQKTNFHKPYKTRRGKRINAFRHSYFKGKAGCYIIKRGIKIVYIGYSSSDVYKTMYRHFQSWNDKTQKRVTYPKTAADLKVKIVLCTPRQAPRLESALIRKHKPKDNTMKLESLFLSEEKRSMQSYQTSQIIKADDFADVDKNETPF